MEFCQENLVKVWNWGSRDHRGVIALSRELEKHYFRSDLSAEIKRMQIIHVLQVVLQCGSLEEEGRPG